MIHAVFLRLYRRRDNANVGLAVFVEEDGSQWDMLTKTKMPPFYFGDDWQMVKELSTDQMVCMEGASSGDRESSNDGQSSRQT